MKLLEETLDPDYPAVALWLGDLVNNLQEQVGKKALEVQQG